MKLLAGIVCVVLCISLSDGQVFDQELQKHQISEMDRYIKIRLLAIIKSKINDTMANYQRLISECETNINQTVDKCTTCAAKNCIPSSVLKSVDSNGRKLLQDVGRDTENFFISLQNSFQLGKEATGITNATSTSSTSLTDVQKNSTIKHDLGTQIYKAADSVKLSLASGINSLEKGLNTKTHGVPIKSLVKRSIRSRRMAPCTKACVPCQEINSTVKTIQAIITGVCGTLHTNDKKAIKDELVKMSELYNAAKGNMILVSRVTYTFDVKKMMKGDTSFAGKKIIANLHGTIRTLPTSIVIRPFNLRGTAVELAREIYNKW